MAIGLGQMLIGGLLGNEIGKKGGLSGLLGGNQPEMPQQPQMPTQTAQAPQQQGGGFMQSISNMMGNPTDSQIA